MARADDSALGSKPAPQPDIQSVGQHDETRGNFLAIRQKQFLPVVAGRNRGHFRPDRFDLRGDLGANRIDQPVVEDAVLLAWPLVEQIAGARDPVFAVMRRRTQRRFGKAGLAKTLDLPVTAELFNAKVRRIDRVRIDQNRRSAGTPEHRGGCRTGKATSDDGNIRVLHGPIPSWTPHHCAGKGK